MRQYFALALVIIGHIGCLESAPVPEPWYGDFIGALNDPQNIGIKGDVYVVNDTCLQIIGFAYNADMPDVYFWADTSPSLTSTGVRIPTFEFGNKPLNVYSNARVVIMLPQNHRVTDFKAFGLWCQSFLKDYGHVSVPDDLQPPRVAFLNGTIAATNNGQKYGVASGPVLVLDRRTVKIYGFVFRGDDAPDGNILAGKGTLNPENGLRIGIRGRDEPDRITAIHDRYSGQDIIIELPSTHDIYSIEWISVYCIRFRVDFGHVEVGRISDRIPPYVPPQRMYDDMIVDRKPDWPVTTLVGKPGRTNFTFQLGPPGGRRAYEAWAEARPNEYVWYVNGYMTPELVLQRGLTYTFNIQGGDDSTTVHFFNPLYISNEPFGGYMKLPEDDKQKVIVYAGLNQLGKPVSNRDGNATGSLCLWTERESNANPDLFNDFTDYSKELKLTCQKKNGKSGFIRWTPDQNAADTVYYQSYTNYNMGYKIRLVDQIPSDVEDSDDIPYDYEIWLEHNAILRVPKSNNSGASTAPRASMTSLFVSLTSLFLGVWLTLRPT